MAVITHKDSQLIFRNDSGPGSVLFIQYLQCKACITISTLSTRKYTQKAELICADPHSHQVGGYLISDLPGPA